MRAPVPTEAVSDAPRARADMAMPRHSASRGIAWECRRTRLLGVVEAAARVYGVGARRGPLTQRVQSGRLATPSFRVGGPGPRDGAPTLEPVPSVPCVRRLTRAE
jgi:hypothetical protein